MIKDQYDTSEGGGAQFNIGLATAITIRNLLNECNTLSRQGSFVDWYNTILTIDKEICAETKYKKHETNIKNKLSDVNKSMSDWQRKPGIDFTKDVFQNLYEMERQIRIAIKDCGLGMPDKEDDDGL